MTTEGKTNAQFTTARIKLGGFKAMLDSLETEEAEELLRLARSRTQARTPVEELPPATGNPPRGMGKLVLTCGSGR